MQPLRSMARCGLARALVFAALFGSLLTACAVGGSPVIADPDATTTTTGQGI